MILWFKGFSCNYLHIKWAWGLFSWTKNLNHLVFYLKHAWSSLIQTFSFSNVTRWLVGHRCSCRFWSLLWQFEGWEELWLCWPPSCRACTHGFPSVRSPLITTWGSPIWWCAAIRTPSEFSPTSCSTSRGRGTCSKGPRINTRWWGGTLL